MYREAMEDMDICGTFVPKGTVVLVMPSVTSRSHAIWGPDAEECRPERWDRLEGDAASVYAYGAFSNGPRICIGKNFAVMEFKTYVVAMVSRFRLSKGPMLEALGGEHIRYQNPSLTLWPEGGLQLKVERL